VPCSRSADSRFQLSASTANGEFDLLGEQRHEAAVVVLAGRLTAAGQEIGAAEVGQQVVRVDDGDHRVDCRDVVQAVAGFVGEVEGGGHRHRLGDAGRFDQQRVEAAFGGQAAHFLQEVIAQRAADAAVAHLDELLVGARELRLAADDLRVDVDLAHVVDDDRDAPALAVAQHMVQQRGLAGAEKAGQNGYGQHAHRRLL
jgi:hypothetical protein